MATNDKIRLTPLSKTLIKLATACLLIIAITAAMYTHTIYIGKLQTIETLKSEIQSLQNQKELYARIFAEFDTETILRNAEGAPAPRPIKTSDKIIFIPK